MFYGVGFQRKVDNKIFYELNGSGILNIRGNQNGVFIDLFYSVYTKMIGELCKNGNIKFKADVNGTTTKALFNDKIVDFTNTYASNYEFCAKRLIQ